MFKNTAGQKLSVYAWDSATGLPKTGDAANLTAYRSLDDGTVTVLTDASATETDATNAKGYYLFDLSQAETNGDKIAFSAKSSTSGIVVLAVPAVVQTVPSSGVANAADQTLIKTKTDQMTFTVANAVDINVVAWLGYVATVDANNYPFIGSVNTKTGYALTGAYDPAKTAAQATTALDNTVWTNTKAGYLDAAVSSASAPTAAAVADAVWDEPLSGHATSGTTGAGLTAAQSAGDPWSTTVPGAYAAGSAGHKFGNLPTAAEVATELSAGEITITTSPITLGNALNIYTGDDYKAANSKSITFALVSRSDLIGLIPHLVGKSGTVTFDIAAPAVVSATQTITFGDLTSTVTLTLKAGSEENPHEGEYQIRFLDGSGNKVTQVSGVMYVRTGLSA